MRYFFAIAALISVALHPAALAAETGLGTLFDREQASLSGLAAGRLRALLSPVPRGDATATEVSFTRAWVDAQPEASGGADWSCLSEALYFEARGETVKGQFAVAEVILNRVRSARFPGTICGVVKQGTGRKYQCQFTYACDGRKEVITEPKAYKRVSKVARAAMDGAAGNLTDGATYYHTVAVRPAWSRKFTRTARIGVHIFYRDSYRTASSE